MSRRLEASNELQCACMSNKPKNFTEQKQWLESTTCFVCHAAADHPPRERA